MLCTYYKLDFDRFHWQVSTYRVYDFCLCYAVSFEEDDHIFQAKIVSVSDSTVQTNVTEEAWSPVFMDKTFNEQYILKVVKVEVSLVQ